MESQQLQQARILRERHRYPESEAMLLTYLASNPDDAEAHCELALTRMSMEKRDKDALESIETAIGLHPDSAWMQAVRSFVLSNLEKYDKAFKAANEAIAVDPMCELAWVAKARSLGGKEKWKDAEAAVRKALELDPDDAQANNLLSLYLRVQGKTEEATHFTDIQLSQNAEDPFALANAGWTKLHQSKYKEAEQMFLDALRLDPEQEYARQGLRETYKTRSLFYRMYLKWALFMQRFEGKSQTIIVIGLFLGYKLGSAVLDKIHPGLAIVLSLVYMIFMFWVWLASGFGHFLLLVDRKARMSLNRNEKLDGILVGGVFVTGLGFMLAGLHPALPSFTFMGIATIVAAIPLSLVALNKKLIGRVLFGSFGALAIFFGVWDLLSVYIGGGGMTGFFVLSILISFISTWLAMIPGVR